MVRKLRTLRLDQSVCDQLIFHLLTGAVIGALIWKML
jgi:hypothetical protein